jgi:hypothetical protein
VKLRQGSIRIIWPHPRHAAQYDLDMPEMCFAFIRPDERRDHEKLFGRAPGSLLLDPTACTKNEIYRELVALIRIRRFRVILGMEPCRLFCRIMMTIEGDFTPEQLAERFWPNA